MKKTRINKFIYFPILSILIMTNSVGVTFAQAAQSFVAKSENGSSISVSKVLNLNPNGVDLTVRGKGFDSSSGIYVGVCVKVKTGMKPTPCGGGADMTGATGGSIWISSNPPAYGVGVARPFSKNGKFKVRIRATAMMGKVDCRTRSCAVYVRADRLRSDDRSADLAVPITFTKKGKVTKPFVQNPSLATTTAPSASPSVSPSPSTSPLALVNVTIMATTSTGVELKTAGQPPTLSKSSPLNFTVTTNSTATLSVGIDAANTKGICTVVASGTGYTLTALDGTVCTVKISTGANSTYNEGTKYLPFIITP